MSECKYCVLMQTIVEFREDQEAENNTLLFQIAVILTRCHAICVLVSINHLDLSY